MSLINDALKRAKQAQTENPMPTPDLPFRAAEPVQTRNTGFPLLPVAVLVIAVLLGGSFIIVALQKWNAAPQVVHATQPDTTPATALDSAPPTPPTSAATATTIATQIQSPAATPATVSPSGSPADAPVAEVNPEPPKPVVPKLQGIFYNPSRPSAVVNGKTVYIGSRAGEARDFLVLAISRESVTVGNGSQTNVLILEE